MITGLGCGSVDRVLLAMTHDVWVSVLSMEKNTWVTFAIPALRRCSQTDQEPRSEWTTQSSRLAGATMRLFQKKKKKLK